MTSLIAEEPLDRLNYFNGQRLEARDLRVEQDYHMRVRRLLNRALYTPGIASGLEVLPAANPHAVRVSPGVALDALGREVILLEETEVQVRGRPNTDPAWVYGNFLFIQYAEEPTAALTDGCALSSGRAELAWGGPTRIRAMPVLGFSDSWPDEGPDEGAGQILLAQVELDGGCAVAQIRNQARKYVDSARSATRTMSYEGEKDIDKSNSKRLSFHVLGGPASAVTLYLWADTLSTLYYTEIGAHRHEIPELETSTEGLAEYDLSHDHDIDLSAVGTLDDGEPHDHNLKIPVSEEGNNEDAVKLANNPSDTKLFKDLGNDDFRPEVLGGQHTHVLSGVHSTQPTTGLSVPDTTHHHTTKTTKSNGEPVTTKRTGQGDLIDSKRTDPLAYIDELKVWLDGTDITDAILAQLGGPANGWERLGDGTAAHKLQVDRGGTGAVALERIAALGQGEHTLELLVENDSGGNLRYNLYVE